jgi:hypothetical protein
LQVAKIGIFSLLIPFEIIASRIIESGLSDSEDINAQMYRNLLISAYEDGIVTDMERAILQSSASQLGLSKQAAQTIEANYLKELGLEGATDDDMEATVETAVSPNPEG